MLRLSRRHQWIVGFILITLLILTRGHHIATLNHLPSASWAVFFLAGVYLRPIWILPVLLSTAFALDFAAVTWGGVSHFCISPAYPFLLPAYGSLWLAGRWYAYLYRPIWSTFLPLSAMLLLGATLCELFSSGSFYFLSGRFDAPTVTEFAARLATYYPSSLGAVVFYVGLVGLIHAALFLLRRNQPSLDRAKA